MEENPAPIPPSQPPIPAKYVVALLFAALIVIRILPDGISMYLQQLSLRISVLKAKRSE